MYLSRMVLVHGKTTEITQNHFCSDFLLIKELEILLFSPSVDSAIQIADDFLLFPPPCILSL